MANHFNLDVYDMLCMLQHACKPQCASLEKPVAIHAVIHRPTLVV